jgi:hypothetical protein
MAVSSSSSECNDDQDSDSDSDHEACDEEAAFADALLLLSRKKAKDEWGELVY